MAITDHKQKQTKSLFNIATKGHYLLFETEWIRDFTTSNLNLTKNDINLEKANNVFSKLNQYSNLEKKRIYLHSLNKEMRNNFLLYFFTKVEILLQSKKIPLQ